MPPVFEILRQVRFLGLLQQVPLRIRIYIYVEGEIYINIDIYIDICSYIYIYVCPYISIYIYLSLSLFLLFIYSFIHIHTHPHTHTHTHTHTRTDAWHRLTANQSVGSTRPGLLLPLGLHCGTCLILTTAAHPGQLRLRNSRAGSERGVAWRLLQFIPYIPNDLQNRGP